ncbi:hypothetical protein [Streptomyces sp. URMC 129]|uniref:hypothetical protein n=1 Tax=Streptomyces sp. URMC 129 TaxID=3423407 RepID=UPI003F1E0360
MATVTIKRLGNQPGVTESRYRLTHSRLPGQNWVRDYRGMIADLMVACDFDAPTARGAVMDAFILGEVSIETEG